MSNPVQQLGQLFIVGFPGAAPSAEFIDFLAEIDLGGVILFADNCEEPAVLAQALSDLKRHQPSLLVAIDQEGGSVCRLRGNPAEYASADDYGRSHDHDRFAADYSRAARFMADLGINLNLAPVADLFSSADNDCLRGRCYGQTAEEVIPFLRSSIEISRRHGLLSCLKHFPGLGAATIDPHKATTEVTYDAGEWHRRERLSFAAGVEAGCDLVMTTHLIAPAIDQTIATGSEVIVEDLLRHDLGFEGPAITDELCMLGADVLGDIGRRTVAAMRAGHDILLFGQDWRKARSAYRAVLQAISDGEIPLTRLRQALDRVAELRQKISRERKRC